MWVDFSYYTGNFHGTAVKAENFVIMNESAQEFIQIITRWQVPDDISGMTKSEQNALKRAVCYQMDYFAEYGLDVGFPTSDDSFSVGKVSVSTGSSDTPADKRAKRACPVAMMLLEQSGLLGRQVGIC